jgi:limonene-1,2-epoxide hydrolase
MTHAEICNKLQAMAAAMMRQDNDAVVAHFADDAMMIAPAGRFVGRQAIYAAGHHFNTHYTNIVIEIKRVISCENKGVVEWSFAETRKSDGWTHVMEDAIVFELNVAGLATYWREYFDPNQLDLV